MSNFKHGDSRSSEYKAWKSILSRCYRKKDSFYHRYGGRGITVCDKWRHSYETFIADMGRKPGANYSIDRINNNEGYCKENCRWANPITQGRNKSSNIIIAVNGEAYCISEWATKLGIKANTIQRRLERGYPPEKALSIKNFSVEKERTKKPLLISFNNKILTVNEWAEKLNVSRVTIFNWLKKGKMIRQKTQKLKVN